MSSHSVVSPAPAKLRAGWSALVAFLAAFAVVAAGLAAQAGSPAQAASPSPATHVVSSTPSDKTPQVRDGSVREVTEVGTMVVVGGDFTTVRDAGSSTDIARPWLFAFEKATGKVSQTFLPVLDGRVDSILPGPTAGTVYVAGWFKTVNGQTRRIALLNLADGSTVSSFAATAIDGPINVMQQAGGQILIGGYFTVVGGLKRAGLASLSANGSVTSLLTVKLEENHNWSSPRDPSFTRDPARGSVGTVDMAVDAQGQKLIVIGNFQKANGLDRDQVVWIDLGTSTSSVRADWQTDRYKPACYYWAFDTYMRNVDWAPDGASFSIVTTGGGNVGTLCDTLATWSASSSGTGLNPQWVSSSGGDSLLGLEVTGAAIYGGGHQRWMNNVDGRDFAAAGAVPRPGISASDPRSGVPLSWNPGRHPRGSAAYVIKASSDGIWVGSDTDWYGYIEVFRPRLAFFPIAGGTPLSEGAVSSLPAYGYAATDAGLTRRFVDGSSTGAPEALTVQGLSPSSIRAMTQFDDKMVIASADGFLYWGPLNKDSVGPLTKIDPYNDPKWSTLLAGNGTRTYRGLVPELYGMLSSQISGIAYRAGRLYYTVVGNNKVFWTGFSPESGIVEGFEGTTNSRSLGGTLVDPGDFSVTDAGIVYVQKSTGQLMLAPVTGDVIGASSEVAGTQGVSFAGRAFTLGKGPLSIANVAPVARPTVTCQQLVCTFDGTGSTDEGSIAGYQWDFGDSSVGDGSNVEHAYSSPGDYTATLTVTDDRGATGTASFTVLARQQSVEFVASTGVNLNGSTASVTVPAATLDGDVLLLTVSRSATAAPSVTGSLAWTQQVASQNSSLFSAAWTAVAGASSAGQTVTVRDPAGTLANMDVRLTVYRGVDTAAPVASALSSSYSNVTGIRSPVIPAANAGSWLVTYWSTRSTYVTDIAEPSGVVARGEGTRTGGGHINALVGDSGGPVAGGQVGGLTAVSDTTAPLAGSFSLLLKPRL